MTSTNKTLTSTKALPESIIGSHEGVGSLGQQRGWPETGRDVAKTKLSDVIKCSVIGINDYKYVTNIEAFFYYASTLKEVFLKICWFVGLPSQSNGLQGNKVWLL